MLRISSFVVCLAVLVTTAAASAQDAKVCTVDLQAALASVNEGRTAYAELTEQLQQRQQDLNQQQLDLQEWMAEIEPQMSVLSPAEREARIAEYEARVSALEQAAQSHQEQLQRAELEATQRIAERMISIVQELAQSQGCTMVLQSSAVLYAPDALDFTEELVSIYNTRH